MGNTESNNSNTAGSGEGDSPPRRPWSNTAKVVGAATAVGLAGWGLTKLVSASEEGDENNGVKGKLILEGAGSSRGLGYQSPTTTNNSAFPNQITYNDKGKPSGHRRKLKMNTDGSVRGDPPRMGFGGVIRDENGNWIMGFYGRTLREVKIEQAEIWAIYHGLRIIQDENLREVEISSDCQAAIEFLENKTRKKSAIDDIVEKCKEMLWSTGCTLKKICDKENKVADKLADLGRIQETDTPNVIRLSTPPEEVKCLLDADSRSASSYSY